MGKTFALVALASGVATLVHGWRQTQLRRRIQVRLGLAARPKPAVPARRLAAVPFTRPLFLIPCVAGVLLAASLYFLTGLHLAFAGMFAVIVVLLGCLLEAMRVHRRFALIEAQLSDSIDIIVGALRAGAGVTGALESALAESREPWRSELHEVLNRLRYGDEPSAVFQGLSQRVPLETFRLFAATLITHWEVGGSLAPTMATVGRTIRDRIEIARRIRSLTTQSRVSTIAILAATYFIAAVIWRNDPERMQVFLATSVGRTLVVGAVVMQTIGLVWSAWIGRIKF